MKKYLAVTEVVRHATIRDTPEQLANRVRRMAPQGHYKTVRICEDLRRIARQGGHFTKEKAGITRSDVRHAEKLIDSFKTRGLWRTRG